MKPRAHVFAAALTACGPRVVDAIDSDAGRGTSDDSTSSGLSTTTGPSSTTSGPPTLTTGSGSTSDATFGESSTSSHADSGFIQDPDGNSVCGPAPPGGLFSCGCSVFFQDCPRGEKCNSWANDGTQWWNAMRCSPIDPDAGHPGDPCTVENSPVSGVDSCDAVSMCWDVDPDTLVGICVAFCESPKNDPICSTAGTACLLANDESLALCLPICDPLAALPCDAGESCHPVDDTWLCLPDNAAVEINGLTPTFCEPGSTAIDPASQSYCDPKSDLCCAQICDVTAPACAPPYQCVAFDDGTSAGLCVD